MNKTMRSRWWKPLLLLPLVLFAAQCGDESEVVIEESDCQVDVLERGLYSFNLVNVEHNCPIDVEDFISQQQIPDIELPAYDELPYVIQDLALPLIDAEVTGELSEQGNLVRLATDPQTIEGAFGGVPFTARVLGWICALSGSEVEIELDLAVTVDPPPPLPSVSCNAEIVANGNR